ncbi:SAV_2336 N-terminal domain-related protein [Actinomadura sediminis]|uniref:SAV_2336 N-terminal domain-related protein n=1 Tax=Actinomadura sediminis TaxID=1038904 RepID=A0ABW3EKE3_9ACTN
MTELDARLLAELLWLARNPPPAPPDHRRRLGDGPPPGRPVEPAAPDTAPSGGDARDAGTGAGCGVPLYPPAGTAVDEAGGASAPRMSKIAFPGASPLPEAMELARSLRPFKRLTRPGRSELDMAATVQATAEARTVDPAQLMITMRRARVRSLDFTLVTDSSTSMRVWRPLFERLERVLAQVGAFQTVSRWDLEVDGGGEVRVVDPNGTGYPPSRLLDLSGSRIVLVATDAVAEGWYRRPVWKAVDGWARAMPTTLLHMLPPEYRPDTAVGVPYTASRCPGGMSANAGFEVEWGWWAERERDGAPPLPVIGLSPAEFAGWAEALVSGTTWVQGITTSPPVLAEDLYGEDEGDAADDGDAAADEGADDDADDDAAEQEMLVDAFFRRASPGAVRLAHVLSCATSLTLPLIDVLQPELARGTGLLERAELFVSGLLEETGDDLYEFVPAARERLVTGLSALDEWAISKTVNEHIEGRFGGGGDLTALVRDPEGAAAAGYVRPFAQLARNLAERRGIPVPAWAEDTGRPEPKSGEAPAPESGTSAENRPETASGQAMSLWGPLVAALDGANRREPAAGQPKNSWAPWLVASGMAAVVGLNPVIKAITRRRRSQERAELVAALGARVAEVKAGDELAVVDLGADGLTAYLVRRNTAGTPDATMRPTVPWADALDEAGVPTGAVGIGDGRNIVLVDTAVYSLPVLAALPALKKQVPDGAALTASGADLGQVLREVIDAEPIRQPYALLAMEPERAGGGRRLGFRTVPIFPAGASKGDVRGLVMRIEPSDAHGTVLAVVARGPEGTDRTVLVRSVKAPPGRYSVTAELDGPGRVRFGGLPKSGPEARSWHEIVGAGTVAYDPPRPAHLVCALEFSGPRDVVDERIDRIRRVVGLLAAELGELLRVSLLLYGAHLYRYRPEDDPPVARRVWRANPSYALRCLDGLAATPPLPSGNPEGAMVEDMLFLVQRSLRGVRRPERTALLTVGKRAPHPPEVHPSETLPCPDGHDWTVLMDELHVGGVTFAAIRDHSARRHRTDDMTWVRLAGDAKPFRLDAVDPAAVGRRLGLVPTDAQRVPLPIVVQT